MLQSMAAMASESGAAPQGCSVSAKRAGWSATARLSWFADSYLRGVRDFDVAGAYQVLAASATGPLPKGGRDHVDEYMASGYVPVESGGASGSKTLEYAEDDFALAVLADALGKPTEATSFRERSRSWRTSGTPRAVISSGVTPMARSRKTTTRNGRGIGEVGAYTWFVPHDVAGLAAVMGGMDAS